MGSSFAVGGLASGLPSDMVEQLMATKQQRMKAYERDQTFFSNQKSAFGELQTKLLNLSSVSETLQDDSSWSPHTASSGDSDIITVAADSDAVSGTHQIEIARLASSNTIMSAGGVITDDDELSAFNNFSFNYNNRVYSNASDHYTGTDATRTGFGIAVGDSLEDIASKIGNYNYVDSDGETEDGISASVLYDGTNYRLVLSAKDSGARVRASDGTTTNSRIESLDVDLTWGTSTNSWDTDNASATSSSGISIKGTSDATNTVTEPASTFSFEYGATTYTLTDLGLNGTTFTLDTLATAITNNVADVTASVVNNGTTNYLVMDGSATGKAFTNANVAVNFTFNDAATTNTITHGSGFFQSDEGQDAQLTVDGLSNIYSTSNVVDEVLPGVSMTIQAVTNAAVSVTVSDDTTTLKETLTSFTDAYNDVISYISNNSDTVFSGSTLARSIISQMRGVLNNSTHNKSATSSTDILTPYSILSEMGLRTSQDTGQVSFDSTTLSNALSTNFTVLSDMFTNTQAEVGDGYNAGIAYRFEDIVDDLTSSTDGSLTGRDEGLQSRLDSLEASIERETRRLEIVRGRLTKKYANLEQLVNSLNANGSALTSALSSLG
jgi:flagellar hook-associated protein 2